MQHKGADGDTCGVWRRATGPFGVSSGQAVQLNVLARSAPMNTSYPGARSSMPSMLPGSGAPLRTEQTHLTAL